MFKHLLATASVALALQAVPALAGTTAATTNHVDAGHKLAGAVDLAAYSQFWTEDRTVATGPSSPSRGAAAVVAVPEPASFLALGAGLFGLAFLRRPRGASRA